MATAPIEERMLIKVSAEANNNKFYHVVLSSDGTTVTKRWGRVGSDGTTAVERTGAIGFDRIIREKTRRGYKPTNIVSANVSVNTQSTNQLAEVAKTVLTTAEHKGNPVLEALIERLVAINRHEILETSGGLIKVNHDGVITTPLGLISLKSINEAKNILKKIKASPDASDPQTIRFLEEYLSLVPQKLGRQGWKDTFVEQESLDKQFEFLEQLKNSLTWHEDSVHATQKADLGGEDIAEKYKALFKYHISPLDPKDPRFKEIEKMFSATKNSIHSASRLRLKRVFVLTDEEGEKEYQKVLKAIGNEKRLWHGSQTFNVLSILRKGLFVPPNTGTYKIQGRMFGPGVYFSDQSTKSLNYASGYWGGNRDTNCFMFLADVAMGMEYRPQGKFNLNEAHTGKHPKYGKKYSSISIKGGTCGVMNNEMIAFESSQIQLRYLCEFDV